MKDKNSRKYVIVSQKFHPNQIGELAMFCVSVEVEKLDELFEFVVNNGGRVISAIPCNVVPKGSIMDVVKGYTATHYFVVCVCQKEIVDILMMNLCREFKIDKRKHEQAFVIDVLGYMGAKGPFVE